MSEAIEPDGEMEFKHRFRAPIERLDKTATVRLDDADDVAIGDVLDLVDEDGEHIDSVLVTHAREVAAVDAIETIEEWGVAYPIDDSTALIAELDGLYSDPVRPDTTVRVLAWTPLRELPQRVSPEYVPDDGREISVGHHNQYHARLEDGHVRVTRDRRQPTPDGMASRGSSSCVYAGPVEEASHVHEALDRLFDPQAAVDRGYATLSPLRSRSDPDPDDGEEEPDGLSWFWAKTLTMLVPLAASFAITYWLLAGETLTVNGESATFTPRLVLTSFVPVVVLWLALLFWQSRLQKRRYGGPA